MHVINVRAPVAPSAQTVQSGSYAPLSRPQFIYVNTRSAGRPEVQQFILFYMQQAPALVKEVGYVPLPAAVYSLAYRRFQQRVTGSMFADRSTVGADLLKIMKRDTTDAH